MITAAGRGLPGKLAATVNDTPFMFIDVNIFANAVIPAKAGIHQSHIPDACLCGVTLLAGKKLIKRLSFNCRALTTDHPVGAPNYIIVESW